MTNDFIEAGKRVRLAAEKLKSTDLEIERLETLKAERSAQEAELEAAQAVLLDAAEAFEEAPVVSLETVQTDHADELFGEGVVGTVEVTDVVTAQVEDVDKYAGDDAHGVDADPRLETEITDFDELAIPTVDERRAEIDARNAEIQKLREEREARDAANVPANEPSPEAEMAGVMMQEASERLAETVEQVSEAKTTIDATNDILPEPTQDQIDAVLNDDTPFPGIGGGRPNGTSD